MGKKRIVSSMMTPNVIVASTKTTFSQIMEFFETYNIQHLPVADGDRLIGILSINDITKFLGRKLKSGSAFNLASLDANFDILDVVTTNPVCVSPEDDFLNVVEILAMGKFQSVPIVKDGLIVGIITNKDVVKVYGESQ